ncbi:MAG: flagellar basal body P-ring formation chaperone FlgA [Mariprofundaceae bacterium]
MKIICIKSLALLCFWMTIPAGGSAFAAVDDKAKQSLHAFFARGVVLNGAEAKLIEVVRWPEIKGSLRWHLPPMRNHPERVSMIAEQGYGKQVRRWYIPVRVGWWSDAIVINNDVAARALIHKSMVQNERVNIANHPSHWFKEKQQVVGTRLTRPLQSGSVIYKSFVKRPPLLRRGDQVVIIAEVGGITVRTAGKVLRQAGLGDLVMVQNLKSKKKLQAVVVNRFQVKVHTGGAT